MTSVLSRRLFLLNFRPQMECKFAHDLPRFSSAWLQQLIVGDHDFEMDSVRLTHSWKFINLVKYPRRRRSEIGQQPRYIPQFYIQLVNDWSWSFKRLVIISCALKHHQIVLDQSYRSSIYLHQFSNQPSSNLNGSLTAFWIIRDHRTLSFW